MTKEEFRAALTKAVAGDAEALADIVELYMPLFEHYSIVEGSLDEDLLQEILIEVFKSITRFKV